MDFLEKIYENALVIELTGLGLKVIPQQKIVVFYSDQSVGHYFADLVINDCVIVELKATETLQKSDQAQLFNTLKQLKKKLAYY